MSNTENKAQELQKKHFMINNDQAEWYFIGHLQTNKINIVLPYVTCVQSVDRMKLARKLHNHLVKDNKKLDILVQVNTSYEESKFGVLPENKMAFIEQLAEFDTLRIKGLITIGKLFSYLDETRKSFRFLKSIQEEIIEQGYLHSMDVLSMGNV